MSQESTGVSLRSGRRFAETTRQGCSRPVSRPVSYPMDMFINEVCVTFSFLGKIHKLVQELFLCFSQLGIVTVERSDTQVTLQSVFYAVKYLLGEEKDTNVTKTTFPSKGIAERLIFRKTGTKT